MIANLYQITQSKDQNDTHTILAITNTEISAKPTDILFGIFTKFFVFVLVTKLARYKS